MKFQTNHPLIKEIKLGEKFILDNGELVKFDHYDPYNLVYPYFMIEMKKSTFARSYVAFDLKLYHESGYNIKTKLQIVGKYLSLKEKIDLI